MPRWLIMPASNIWVALPGLRTLGTIRVRRMGILHTGQVGRLVPCARQAASAAGRRGRAPAESRTASRLRPCGGGETPGATKSAYSTRRANMLPDATLQEASNDYEKKKGEEARPEPRSEVS
jgi:hypothetical protein